MYRSIPREQIIEALIHLRDLHRNSFRPTTEIERLTEERREVVAKYLVSNLRKTNDHPTLKTLLEVATTFSLTMEGAHQLFGYDLEAIRKFDLRLNAGRTHIVDSLISDRERVVELPSQLAPMSAFASDAALTNLVLQWQKSAPTGSLDARSGRRRAAYYVHVGTEDSYGTSLPPGSMALVEPIEEAEAKRPDPRSIYLIQFGNGYRCSRCVVTGARLHLLTSVRSYSGPQQFSYPGSVRLVGRVRLFSHALPQPEYSPSALKAGGLSGAELILPWEHRTRDRLLDAKHKRFQRTKTDESDVRNLLNNVLQSNLSERTERRYRRPSSSKPHVNTLIQMTLANLARYSDTLRGGGPPLPHAGRYSLGTLLGAKHFPDGRTLHTVPSLPTPTDVWSAHKDEFLQYPPLLALKFPQLNWRETPIIRLAGAGELNGIEPPLKAPSWLILDPAPTHPDIGTERGKRGWARPFYVLQRGLEILTGYLDHDGAGYVLTSNPSDASAKLASIPSHELQSVRRVAGVVVPV